MRYRQRRIQKIYTNFDALTLFLQGIILYSQSGCESSKVISVMMERSYMSNNIKYYLWGSINVIVLSFTSQGFIQTFFLEIGFTSRQVGTYASLISVVQILVMIFSVFFADNVKKVKDAISLLTLSRILMCLAMLPACFSDAPNVNVIYYIALICCCIGNLFVGFSNVLSYRLPYIIIDMKDYAKLENNSAIISGIFSILISGGIAFLALIFSFRLIMAVGFSFSIVFCLYSSWLVKSMKIKDECPGDTTKKFQFHKLWEHKFRYFYVPNFLRGITLGLMGVMTVICMKEITSNTSVISGLTAISSLSSIIGCALYQILGNKLKTATLYLLFSIQAFLFLPIMLSGRSVSVFCICYFFIHIATNIINVSGAVYATEIVGYNEMGTYTSVRLITMTLGQAVANYAVVAAMDYLPTALILIICGLAQIASGVMYYYYDVKYQKNY